MLKLTRKNYHTPEANRAYWSASLIKRMMVCPAAALAMEDTPPSAALLVGSYVDAYFEGRLERFTAEHPEVFKRDGTLKADFLKAQKMIERARSDKVFMEYMSGRKQVIKTGEIAGLPFKIKMDVYKKGRRIVDLKTVRDMKPCGAGTFADQWEWPLQMAIYQAVEGNRLDDPFAICASCIVSLITVLAEADVRVCFSIFRPNAFSTAGANNSLSVVAVSAQLRSIKQVAILNGVLLMAETTNKGFSFFHGILPPK